MAGSAIKFVLDRQEMLRRMHAQASSLGEVVPQQTIDQFSDA